MGSMLLSHQFFWIIVFVLMVPYLLKVKMDAGPSGWLAAAMADWQNRHKKSHQIRLSIFFPPIRRRERELSLQFKQGIHYLHLYSIPSTFLCEALGPKASKKDEKILTA